MSKRNVFSLCYWAPIQWYALYLGDNPVIDLHEHFIKQSYRSRAEIAGAQGLQKLIVPVKWRNHLPMREVEIANEFKWQREHLRSLQTNYKNAAYFDFYQHHLLDFYSKEFKYLVELNIASHQLCLRILGVEDKTNFSEYYIESDIQNDYRNQISPKQEPVLNCESAYDQVFMENYSFLSNLSILDLLLNKGPEALQYLNSVQKR